MALTSSEFWDRIAPAYSRQPVADSETYTRKLAATQALMQPSMTVLEFGCGTGSTALAHASHVAQIDATDVSAAMIAIGQQKARDAGDTRPREQPVPRREESRFTLTREHQPLEQH